VIRWWRRQPIQDDRELERETGIAPADHRFVSRGDISRMERQILGPSWGKKRRKFKP
jgi:hypothetical protein